MQLRTIRILIVVGIWSIAGIYLLYQDWAEGQQQKAARKAQQQTQQAMIQTLGLQDYLTFQVEYLPSAHPYPDYGHISAKVIQVKGDSAWLRCSKQDNFSSIHEKIAYFQSAKSTLDTICLTQKALLSTIQRDTILVPQANSRTMLILHLISIDRHDGPALHLAMRDHKHLNFVNLGLPGQVIALEPITGAISTQTPLPQPINDNNALLLNTKREKGQIEFRIILSSPENPRIVYHVKGDPKETSVNRIY
jgi:hypothetical protein